MQAARARQDRLTKPPGSLGRLETLSVQVAGITGQARPVIAHKAVITCAGDHGVAAQGVSAYPQAVTAQMVANFLDGGAAINVLARHVGARVVVVDAGVVADLDPRPGLVIKKIAPGTADMSQGPAMSRAEATQSIEAGIEALKEEVARGLSIVASGDMGIANTTPSSAMVAAITGRPVAEVTGRGTGISDEQLAHKVAVIEKALSVNRPDPHDMGRAMAWFPVVGLVLGALLALADVAGRAFFPPLVNAALLLSTWVALTGALHLDGFLDCCDGLLATKPPERRLEILRDTHVGAFAVVGAVCLLLLKFALLWELPASRRAPALLIVPALSRAAMTYAARACPYARPGPGLGQLFRQGLTWRHVLAAGVVAVSAAGLALGLTGLGAALWVWLMTLGIAAWVRRRIPGLTGDVYGAINELSEVGALSFVLLVEGLR
jgi:nicotinate-nucleotide--dimethylbenzimidazole phosphoribosyltransferase